MTSQLQLCHTAYYIKSIRLACRAREQIFCQLASTNALKNPSHVTNACLKIKRSQVKYHTAETSGSQSHNALISDVANLFVEYF